jgi:hypothetical protein
VSEIQDGALRSSGRVAAFVIGHVRYGEREWKIKGVHDLFAPLDHQKMKHFFTRGEESGERERRKREKRRDRTSLLAAYQIHN